MSCESTPESLADAAAIMSDLDLIRRKYAAMDEPTRRSFMLLMQGSFTPEQMVGIADMTGLPLTQ